MNETESNDEQCGDVKTIMARVGPAGDEIPIKPKCIKDKGHNGPHSNGDYHWKNVR